MIMLIDYIITKLYYVRVFRISCSMPAEGSVGMKYLVIFPRVSLTAADTLRISL